MANDNRATRSITAVLPQSRQRVRPSADENSFCSEIPPRESLFYQAAAREPPRQLLPQPRCFSRGTPLRPLRDRLHGSAIGSHPAWLPVALKFPGSARKRQDGLSRLTFLRKTTAARDRQPKPPHQGMRIRPPRPRHCANAVPAPFRTFDHGLQKAYATLTLERLNANFLR